MAQPLSGSDREGTACELPGAPPPRTAGEEPAWTRPLPASRLSPCPFWHGLGGVLQSSMGNK